MSVLFAKTLVIRGFLEVNRYMDGAGRDKSLTYHRKTGLTGSYLKRIAAGELAEADNYCTGQRNLECPPHFVSGGFREAIRCRLVRSLTDLRCLRRPDHISDRKRAARPSSIP
jgi:hypothetical protein